MIGEVLGAVGLGGEVRVRPLTDFPDRLLELDEVRLRRRGPGAAKRVELRRVVRVERRGTAFILAIEGVVSRELAAGLAGATLEIPLSQAQELPEGRYYRFDLIGLAVEDEEGRPLGRVREIIETGANDVFVVTPDEAQDRREETLIPALKETVLVLDPAAGRMVVRRPRVWGEED